ncbi:MAG: 1-acyl-sn-glycerol-3-phosphate acyltransferase [Thiothrix sp.]|nr:1-acyl-sn-glycerol-3-phosphate acyltransferase [Thiothrix sp.]HPE60522.1 lysophospholipid acyltransferase family protein [Thiolinea sp.]
MLPVLRAVAYWLGWVLSTMAYSLVFPLLFFLPYWKRYPVLMSWARFNIWWLGITCGVRYRVLGQENIPRDRSAIVMSNHQSTWETMLLPQLFPPLTWVLKRELLRIPLFGWGLQLIRPIAIDRKAGRLAVDQVKQQGKERLDAGIWIIVFPEGTRVKPGQSVRYKLGGAVLATFAGCPVVPVAHNAGESWPRHAFVKHPGVITVSIGKPIWPDGMTPEDLMEQVQGWIERERAKLVFEPA